MSEFLARGFCAPYILCVVMLFIGGVVMFRLSRIRRDYDIAIDMPALTSSQWFWLGVFAFFAAARNLLELTLNLWPETFRDLPQLAIPFILGLGALSLFESGRKYFTAWLKPWIHIPFIVLFLYSLTLTPVDCERYVRQFILAPAAVLAAVSYLRRLHVLNINAPQICASSWLLALYGVVSGILHPTTMRFSSRADTFFSNDMELTYLMQMAGALIILLGISLIMDHYGVVRDRYFDGITKRKREHLRRLFLIVLGMVFVLGVTFADIGAIRAGQRFNDNVMSVAEIVSKRFAQLSDNELRRPDHLRLLNDDCLMISGVRLFYRNDHRWEAIDERGNVGYYPNDVVMLDNVERLGVSQRMRNLHAVFVPILTSDNELRAILCAQLDLHQIRKAMASERVIILFSTFLVLCLLSMMWLAYAANQERRLLISNAVQQFNQLFKESQTIEMIVDPRTATIVEANLYADHFFGYPPGGLKRKRLDELNLVQADPTQKRVENAVVDYELRRSNGEVCYLQLRMWPIRFQGAILEFCLFSDQSEFVLEERKLQGDLTEIQTLFDALPVPVYLKNSSGYYLVCNQLFADFFNARKSGIIGHHMSEFLTPETVVNITDGDNRVRQHGNSPLVTRAIIAPLKGEPVEVIYSRTPYSWQGDPKAILGTLVVPARIESEPESKKSLPDG